MVRGGFLRTKYEKAENYLSPEVRAFSSMETVTPTITSVQSCSNPFRIRMEPGYHFRFEFVGTFTTNFLKEQSKNWEL